MKPARLLVWIAAGCFPVAFSALAAPPLGCIENSMGARYCLDWQKKNAISNDQKPVFSDPHPATIVKPRMPYKPIGQQVASLRDSDFLPIYFIPRCISVEEKTAVATQGKPNE